MENETTVWMGTKKHTQYITVESGFPETKSQMKYGKNINVIVMNRTMFIKKASQIRREVPKKNGEQLAIGRISKESIW